MKMLTFLWLAKRSSNKQKSEKNLKTNKDDNTSSQRIDKFFFNGFCDLIQDRRQNLTLRYDTIDNQKIDTKLR